MRALQRLVVAVVVVLVGCKKEPAPAATTAGSAAAPGSAAVAAPGSAATPTPTPGSADTGSAAEPAAATGKVYNGPTFSITSTLPGPDTKQKDIDTDAGKTTMTMYEFADPKDDNAFQAVETNPI